MMRLRASNLLLRSPSRTNIATLQPRFRWTTPTLTNVPASSHFSVGQTA